MSQEFLLQTAPIPKLDTPRVSNQSSRPESADKPSFSSALEQQVENREVQKSAPEKKVEPQNKSSEKIQEEPADEESGKIMPEETASAEKDIKPKSEQQQLVSTEKLVETEIDVSLITELKTEPTKQATIKLVSEESLNPNKAVASELVVKQVNIKSALSDTLKDKPNATQQALATPVIKSGDADNDGLAFDKSQQTTTLRSDILNALTKNKSSELDGVVKDPKVLVNQLADRSERSSASFVTALTSTNALSATNAVQSNITAQPILAVQPAINSEAWNRVLSSRVVWMAREGVQEASLKLNPANLGSVEVRLNMHHDQANVLFIAQNAATRDALEQALPRLRESFDENGMQLAGADVTEQEFEQDDNESANGGTANNDAEQPSQIEGSNGQAVSTEQEIELGLSIYA